MRRLMQTMALLLVAAVLAGPAEAGNARRIGTAGAQELRIPMGTRGIALGGATVSSEHGVESIYYNPAGLGNLQGAQAFFGNTNYLADMKVRSFAVASRQYIGVFALSAKVLDLGDLYVTTEDAPEGTGQVETMRFATVGVSYARFLTDAIAFGLTFNYINEAVLSSSANGLALDLGLQYDAQRNGMKFGLVMKNVGPNMRFSGSDFEYTLRLPGDDPQAANRTVTAMSSDFELPSYFQMGGEIRAWQQADSKVTAYGSFQSNNFSQDEYRGALEYGYREMLMVRGGYMYADQDEYLYGPTFGVGFHLPLGATSLSVDYALQTVDSYFDDLHTFSATFAF